MHIYHRIHHSSRPNPAIGLSTVGELDIDINEPTYCYCKQVSFGDMIACDGENVSYTYRKEFSVCLSFYY